MIYLIDDNQREMRRNEMGIHFVDDNVFKDILIKKDKLEVNTDLSFLSNAKCILLHTTTEDIDENGNHLSKSTTNANHIKEHISDYGSNIPIVLFSNQMSEITPDTFDYDTNPNCIYQIKKNIFYERLYDFLEYYGQTQKIELRIIAYGKNYKAVEISRYSKALIESVIQKGDSDVFKPTWVKLSTLRTFYELADIGNDFDNFVYDLEDNPVPVEKFIENVSLIVENLTEFNGKNNYDWQK